MALSAIATIFTAPMDIYYYIKWIIAYLAIRFGNFYRRRRFHLYDVQATGDPVKLGFVVPNLERDLESPHSEAHLQQSADEVFIYGVNSKNECLLTRIARGPNQIADAWIYLKLANGKTYHLSENVGPQQPFEGDCLTFSCGKLQMHYLLPMRRWRIFYCGMLREASEDNKGVEESVFVKFVFQWTASSDVYDLSPETHQKGFATAMAKTNWKIPFYPPLAKLNDALNFYAQGGVVFGTVSISEGEDYEMYLFGEKMRNIGKSTNIAGCKFTNILGNTPSNGFNFHLGQASIPHIVKNLPYGFNILPCGSLEVIQEAAFSIDGSLHEKYNSHFIATFVSGEKHNITGRITNEPVILYSGQGWSGYLELAFIEFKVGSRKGTGILLTGEVYDQPKKNIKSLSPTPPPIDVPLTVQFIDKASEFGEVSGGKGSSLGKLTRLSQELKTFTVPKGIVVTTAAYKEFLTPEIEAAVKNLENVLYRNVNGNVKNACEVVSYTVKNTAMPHKVVHSVIHDLKDIFGEETNSTKFAVRSSATGEDTSTMSAAGQMDTFLGVQGINEIINAIKKCWASQFGHIAVEYKRRNGQVLNSPMAVVVQEMVACEVSGVLFTCDPVSNNPAVITVTANYGLGETVVSGSVEPDTYTLHRKPDGKLVMGDTLIGTKLQKMTMQESGGTIMEDVSEESQGASCLPKETIEKLGRLAIKFKLSRRYKLRQRLSIS